MEGKDETRTPAAAGQYEVYPDGKGDLSLEMLLRGAVSEFHRRHRRLPQEVVVHPSVAEEARKALKALDLSHIPLTVSGGCLQREVWLGLGGEDDEQP